MPCREQILEKIKEQYPYLSKEFGVQRIGLFGSVARQSETEDSDIDLVVEFSKPVGFRFVGFVEYMETLFGRKVDVVTHEGIRNIRIKKVSSDIEKEIIYV
jgi:predicted nucleotidyltransferase